MLITFANQFISISESTDGIISIVLIMIVVPCFYVLRGLAMIGILIPLYDSSIKVIKKKEIAINIVLIICWVVGNTIILISPIISDFWTWGDPVGLFIVFYKIYKAYKCTIPSMDFYYKKYNKAHPHHFNNKIHNKKQNL